TYAPGYPFWRAITPCHCTGGVGCGCGRRVFDCKSLPGNDLRECNGQPEPFPDFLLRWAMCFAFPPKGSCRSHSACTAIRWKKRGGFAMLRRWLALATLIAG